MWKNGKTFSQDTFINSVTSMHAYIFHLTCHNAIMFSLVPSNHQLQHHIGLPHYFFFLSQVSKSRVCCTVFWWSLISVWFILQPQPPPTPFHHHTSSPDPPRFPCSEIGNLRCQQQKEPIVINSPKLTTAADCELGNTMEIRNHLTPECNDQYY